jgi:hypothetical protein
MSISTPEREKLLQITRRKHETRTATYISVKYYRYTLRRACRKDKDKEGNVLALPDIEVLFLVIGISSKRVHSDPSNPHGNEK